MANNHKTIFGPLYNQRDLENTTLPSVRYNTKSLSKLCIFNRVLLFSAENEKPRKTLDICCFYDINAALLRYNMHYDTMIRYFLSYSGHGVSDCDMSLPELLLTLSQETQK
ncbi:hypothetical protein G7046_g3927 [Stylonectria norvegica]|nr:hypothetical protein G7046_g3927 [Stylonectria norvegica]